MTVEAQAYNIPKYKVTLLLEKGEIVCGECGCTFYAQVPFRHRPKVRCTICKTLNELPVSPTR